MKTKKIQSKKAVKRDIDFVNLLANVMPCGNPTKEQFEIVRQAWKREGIIK
jgi:hypothetical protein